MDDCRFQRSPMALIYLKMAKPFTVSPLARSAVFFKPAIDKRDGFVKAWQMRAFFRGNGLHQLVNTFDILGTRSQGARSR
jgi:hypothetical protein